MTVELSDEQYGAVARALVVIAAGKRVTNEGRFRRIPRAEMITRAREVCTAINLQYLGDGRGGSSFPEEIGLGNLRKEAQP
jgi:hypothetical protein